MVRIFITDDSLVARMSLKSCIPKDVGHENIVIRVDDTLYEAKHAGRNRVTYQPGAK
jgi:PleD family two-component response regulator